MNLARIAGERVALRAAVSSLAAQAAISLINNHGDIGKTLKELGSSQTVKAALAAALTAGVLDKIGATEAMKSLTGPNATFSDKLTYNLINATGRALTNTAINGGNLEDALKQALVGGIDADTGAARVPQLVDDSGEQHSMACDLGTGFGQCIAQFVERVILESHAGLQFLDAGLLVHAGILTDRPRPMPQ